MSTHSVRRFDCCSAQPDKPESPATAEDVYEVEAILGKRRGSTTEYKIRWRGYPDEAVCIRSMLFKPSPLLIPAYLARYRSGGIL